MATRCPLFVELCSGSAAVLLRLLGLRRPPISYMGAKTVLATPILHAVGLGPGQGAEVAVLVDQGPWGAVWSELLDPDGSAQVAAKLRSWAQEAPRALWDRLAATAPADLDLWAPGDVAAWLWVQARTCNCVPVFPEAGSWRMCEKRTSARRHLCQTHDEVVGAKPLVQRNAGASETSSWGLQSTETVARRIEAIATWLVLQGRACNNLPLRVGEGRVELPRDATGLWDRAGQTNHGVTQTTIADRVEAIAAWLYRAGNSWRGAGKDWRSSEHQVEPGACQITAGRLASRVEALRRSPVDLVGVLRTDVATLAPPADVLPGTVVYFDPPYQGRTGYGFDLPRAQVLDVARAWADAGALVAVSEAEPLPLPGWHHVELTGAMVRNNPAWQRRREFLTMSRPAAALAPSAMRQACLEGIA